MRHDKLQAFELRKEGKTYNEIKEFLKVSKSTLFLWFKDEKWSEDIKRINKEAHIKNSTAHLKKINEVRKTTLEEKYKEVEKEAEKEFEVYKNDPLFMGGLMLYAGEGDKRSRNLIRLSNSESYLHLVFIRFSEKFLKVGRDKIKMWLLLYPDHNIKECLEWWSRETKINKANFHKSQVINGKSKSRKLQYGVGNSIISSTSLKKKMLKWLELCRLSFN